ncbi:MAG: hypothetical protein JGK24_24680 [Microcoleus sp. PH2017_29_MFU_D_A]|uniref:hypothetical protein n=1 Tax=unclassified Microcoleus TaxID=2642155 RepID=UPI001D3067B6|nr:MULTISPECIES: hypothetical protein [unclassified Microcoleus]MCC3419586.1 hypothetical protein [Microcoleus sp. PH2017_07_MST_O_A]MCC3428839.1 hypothetical protein [Microcoleus sp. PH2017_04_SCI_O_A]MCC3440790.1 hypothetical protein [Microcoleus sp. PH2017_03_ELD_O_A]MCC3466441.1 hypothetical protein [Microcoleus sp. PH2017_06_SFM_O_A]MCC3505455.1 hypothetical protein [Microcoleus sp. PH2017_19_SFW_U_A]MCC3510726.1 hypothetical protein [Microcoleus sp. PH2017_17_BER_D_A]
MSKAIARQNFPTISHQSSITAYLRRKRRKKAAFSDRRERLLFAINRMKKAHARTS